MRPSGRNTYSLTTELVIKWRVISIFEQMTMYNSNLIESKESNDGLKTTCLLLFSVRDLERGGHKKCYGL